MKNHPSIRTRLITALLFFALIPSLCTSIIMYITIFRSERERALRSAEGAVSQMAEELNLLVRKTEINAQTLSADRTLRMAYNDFLMGVSLSEEIDYYRSITDVLNWARVNQNLVNIRVYLPDSRLTTREQLSIFGLSMLDNSLPENVRTGNTVTGWLGTQTRISYFQKVPLRGSSGGIVLILDHNVSAFTEIFRARSIAGDFKILFPGGETAVQFQNGNPGYRGKNLALNANAGAWRIEALVPEEQFLTAGSGALWLLSFGSISVCGLLIPLAANLNAKRLSREISGFTGALRVVQDGQYLAIPVDGTTRELRFLQEIFNNMVDQIDSLINEVYAKQIVLKEAQLARLYEQIKPHFLYNILDSGRWMALRNNDKETSVFLEKVSKMYRLGLSRGADIVPLRQELEHIRLYMDLMPYRSRQVIHYYEEVPEEILNTPVIKLLLQPLVENAIEHGIRQRDGDGLIEISAHRFENTLEIRVCDDGIGLSQELLSEINEGNSSGYGLENVRNRLRLQYNDTFTFRFENRQPVGVCVVVTFPV